MIAGSVSLIGFGLDSIIEVSSGTALLWRFGHDLNRSRREQAKRITFADRRWVLRCAGDVHCLRIRLHNRPPRA